jgi:hypothetical protein
MENKVKKENHRLLSSLSPDSVPMSVGIDVAMAYAPTLAATTLATTTWARRRSTGVAAGGGDFCGAAALAASGEERIEEQERPNESLG